MTVDSLCITSWRARPVSSSADDAVREQLHPAARAARDVRGLHGTLVSSAPGDLDLHVEALEHCRYTSILRMTYLFDADDGRVAEPDLEVRVYHDARLAEACQSAEHLRHPALTGLRDSLPRARPALGRNMLLNKWLDYCSERGHRPSCGPRPGLP